MSEPFDVPSGCDVNITGADPGFPEGGGTDPLRRGAPTYDFVKISEELYKSRKFWAAGRGGARGTP